MVRQTAQTYAEESQQEAQNGATAATQSSESSPKPRTQSSSSPLLDPLAQFAWYHGSIPREEAQCRLEQSGANDG